MKLVIFFCGVVLSVCLLGCTNPHAPAGTVGYVYESPRLWGNGGFRGLVEGPGNYGLSIWRNRMQTVDIRPITYTEEFDILSSDDLKLSFRFHTVLKVDGKRVREAVENYGNFYDRFVKEPLRTYVRNTVQGYKATEVKANMREIADEVATEVVKMLKETPFQVIKAEVGNVQYPAAVTSAVEQKLEAEQKLAKKLTEKEIAKKDAEIRIEEARGIAEAQKIINATLTDKYLQHEAIQAQLKMASSPNHTTVYIPSGSNGIPVVRTMN